MHENALKSLDFTHRFLLLFIFRRQHFCWKSFFVVFSVRKIELDHLQEDALSNVSSSLKTRNWKISVVADVSCDIDGPVASTIRPSTIADPLYGYNPTLEKVVDFKNENTIGVMAVDNLPCELPKDASEEFGKMFPMHFINKFMKKVYSQFQPQNI